MNDARADRPAASALLSLRQARGLSIREAARRLGVSPATVLSAERDGDVRRSTLLAYVQRLGASARELLGGEPAIAWSGAAAWSLHARVTRWSARRVERSARVSSDGQVALATRVSGLAPARGVALDASVVERLVGAAWLGALPGRDLVDGTALLRGHSVDVEVAGRRHRVRAGSGGIDYECDERAASPAAPPLGAHVAFGAAAHEGPGCGIAVRAPARRIDIDVTFDGAMPDDVRFRCWPALLAATRHEPDLSAALGALPRVRRHRRGVGVSIDRLHPGFSAGLLWGQDVPSAPEPPGIPTSAPDAGFGEVVRRARVAEGLGARELARRMGVALHTAQACEDGADTRRSVLLALLRALPLLRPEHVLPAGPGSERGSATSVLEGLFGFEVTESIDLRFAADAAWTRVRTRSTCLPGRARPLVVVTTLPRYASARHPRIGPLRSGARRPLSLRTVRDEAGPACIVTRIETEDADRGMTGGREGAVPARRDAEDHGVILHLLRAPARRVSFHVTFAGGRVPARLEAVAVAGCEPLAPRHAAPLGEDAVAAMELRREAKRARVTLTLREPLPGFAYGLRWSR